MNQINKKIKELEKEIEIKASYTTDLGIIKFKEAKLELQTLKFAKIEFEKMINKTEKQIVEDSINDEISIVNFAQELKSQLKGEE